MSAGKVPRFFLIIVSLCFWVVTCCFLDKVIYATEQPTNTKADHSETVRAEMNAHIATLTNKTLELQRELERLSNEIVVLKKSLENERLEKQERLRELGSQAKTIVAERHLKEQYEQITKELKDEMDKLAGQGKLTRGTLGVNIQDLNESLARAFGRNDEDGALVSQVVTNTPADKAGLKAGDIILKFNNKPIKGAFHLIVLIQRATPGTSVPLTIYRDKKMTELTAQIGKRTESTIAATGPGSPSTITEGLGIEIDKLSPDVASKMKLSDGQGGLIKSLNSRGIGSRVGLQAGDVIIEVDGTTFADMVGLDKLWVAATKNRVIRLKIRRGTTDVFLAGQLN